MSECKVKLIPVQGDIIFRVQYKENGIWRDAPCSIRLTEAVNTDLGSFPPLEDHQRIVIEEYTGQECVDLRKK